LANVRSLLRSGVPVTYFCGDLGDSDELRALGATIEAVGSRELRATTPFQAALSGLYNVTAARKLKALIEACDTPGTIYHVHNWSKILSPSIFAALRPVMSRVILTAHDYFLACPNGGFFDFQAHKPCSLKPLSAACVLSNCDRISYAEKMWRLARDIGRRSFMNLANGGGTVLAVHDAMVEMLHRGGIAPSAIKVLRNAVTPWRDSRVAAESNREFLFVGRLDHDKGALLLAEAASKAGVPLTFIGEGQLASTISAVYPQARLAGFQNRDGLHDFAARARCLVVPTRSRETFSLVAFEALASGIPVIISEFAATRDEIVDNGLGLSCNPYDIDALVASLSEIAANDDRVAAMSQRGFAARKTLALSFDDWTQGLLEVYKARLQCEVDDVAPLTMQPLELADAR
jgi:glycosyltransferase involved in cell wall biosynthesis